MLSRLKVVYEHPLFYLTVALVTVLFASVWYRAEAAMQPPALSRWNWSQHPRTLVVHFVGQSGCACGADLVYAVSKVLGEKSASEIVITGPSSRLRDLKLGKLSVDARVRVVPDEQAAAFPYRSMDKSEMLWVVNGRIVHRAFGTLVSEGFLTD